MTDTDKIIEKLDAILNQMEKIHETMLVMAKPQDNQEDTRYCPAQPGLFHGPKDSQGDTGYCQESVSEDGGMSRIFFYDE